MIKGGLFTSGDLPEGRAGSLAEDVFLQGEGRSLDDIALGIDRGWTTVLALTGVTSTVTDVPPNLSPDHVVDSIAGLDAVLATLGG